MLVKTFGSAVYGIDAITITVEVNVDKGMKYFLVGLPDNAVKESQYRIEAALKNVGYNWPVRKITVNMAPADIRKEGSAYDLTIAVGILAATGQIEIPDLESYIIMGELSLDGGLQPIKGALPIAVQARKEGFKNFILPIQNAKEAAIVNDVNIYGISNISEVIEHFNGTKKLVPTEIDTRAEFEHKHNKFDVDFADVKGQETTKRALEIAAAGGHNVILVGPPGVGKTMLAKRVPTILPPLSLHEALETTKIHSVSGNLDENSSLMTKRPFRSPHHTSSTTAIVGGGSNPMPGEISLAHNGVLFLDELPEFSRAALEVMRQPLEDREVTISRAKSTITYPASFMMVASMNPSPSGEFYDPLNPNADSEMAVRRYLSKISGPLLDRIDLHIEVNPIPFEKLSDKSTGTTSEEIRERVIKAREFQLNRYNKIEGLFCNAQLSAKLIKQFCLLDNQSELLIKKAMEKLNLSARSYARILKVSRTIADLELSVKIESKHVAEAIQYRSLDREGWMM